MLKIRALNRESSSDEDFPVIRREAQEEIALEQYNKALRLQNTGCLPESEQILNALLTQNIPQLESHGPLPQSMSTFKYSCHFNIGNIYLKKGEFSRALDSYLSASELDPTDVTLWHKIGQLAVKQDRFRQAIYAFSKGLECSESHWPCLDQLITLLYAMHDTISCLEYIGKALLLDADYTKGLVLRRQIHRDNPFAREYYEQYNPEHVWEPSLFVEIDEKDEEKFVKEAKVLSDHITEVERTLGPKPLQTIPLPVALEDFTWLSLGKTVLALHQYITDNEMCHFTMVDLSKCMSQKRQEPEETSPVIEAQPMEIASEMKVNQEEEKLDIETAIVERRQSQNSDNVNDGQENTPNQTDNDDEQIMEQDGEDQEDNSDAKTDKNSRTLNRSNSNKRKRDLLSDLQIWGWHSKRKSAKKGKPDKDFSVEDALNRIIPKNLLRNKIGEEKYPLEDSMNTMDIYNIYAEENKLNFLSPIHSPKSYSNEEYFGTEREKENISSLWTKKREYCDPIVLIRDFVFGLSKLWHFKWPNELISMYLNAYDMFREHYDLPQVFSDELTFEQIRNEALATLLYGELLNFSRVKDESRNIHMTALAFLQLISGWREDWQHEHISFFVRFFWLRAHIFRREGSNDLAIRALELIQDTILEEEKTGMYILNLPNCLKCGLITGDIVTKILKHLDMITSLSCLEELYNAEKYKEVADILKLTFKNSNHPTCGRMGRPAQIAMLLHCLWYTNLTDCFQWTEECLNEALPHFLKPTKDYEKWEKIIEKCLAFLYEIIKMETVAIVDCLSEDKRARLIEILCKIVCKQLNTECVAKIPLGCITPWILLHFILMREEHRMQANKRTNHLKCDENENINEENEELPPSVAILFSAHEFLGPKGFCLTNSGELLHFILDAILDRLDTPIFEPYRDKIDIHMEQSLFCLYQHPSKKNKISRHLADHNVDPLPLTWQRAFQLYEFYGPDCLPEFNSYKNASVSADTEQLLQRIIALAPPECDPQPFVQKINDFINGKTDKLPEPVDFPNKVRAIYYLIGDYYFKQREFNRSLKYFLMDLCINPSRFDSWACLGLSYVSQLDAKLNYCKKLKSEMEFLDKAKCAQICFRKALELDSGHVMLWIEFGSFEYMAHSFCSRIMKTESDTLSMEKFEYLENQKNNYLESSGRNFEKAIELYNLGDESDADERWLQYYILGKVAEKKQKEPNEYLQHYVTAGKLLHENNAQYPDKINYHNPQPLSVEALELHYRINASVLKYLELHEGKDIPSTIGNNFKKYLDSSIYPKNIPANYNRPNLIEAEIEDKLKKEELRQEVMKCVDDLLVKVGDLVKKQETKTEIKKTEDVIVLSDSDEERMDMEEKPKDSQVLLDKMIQETMRTTNGSDLDANTNKTEKPEKTNRKKEESETDSNIRTSMDDSSSTSSSSSSSSSSSESDSEEDSSSSSTSSSTGTANDTMSQTEIVALVDRCIVGLEQCVVRLPQNYKALYRLAHLYFNYKSRKDLAKSRQLMLSEYTCKSGAVVSGLFSDRRNQNFFNGIWRIPSSEIDRPGSLSAHMSRCVTLLLQILRATNDHKTLVDLYMQFKKTPDPDKIYIKDSERIQFAEQAMTMCIQSFKSQIQNVQNMNDGSVQKLLLDVFRSYQRIQKHIPEKEALFSSMLTEVYRKFRKDKVPENVSVLDLATKFCQQNRIVEKQKKQQMQTQVVMRSPGMTVPPVLPPPSSITPPSQPPLKRPGMGRPRGRPPLPKIPGQSRQQRGKSPNPTTNNPFAQWQKPLIDQNTAYNYMKHYQEELIKQYSKSLSLSQLTQLSQFLNQNQMAQNQQFSNQYFLGQNSLLSNPLIKQTNQFGGLAEKSFKTPSTYLDNFKNFAALKQAKKNLPHTITSNAQATTSKVSTTANSYMNLTHTLTSSAQSSLLNFSQTPKQKPLPPKMDKPLSHSIASITQPVVCKTKTVQPTYKSNPSKYSTADLAKIKTSSQVFKEPKAIDKATANILMKDRPNISITPVMTTSNLMTSSTYKTSPGKTLQEKLADKQKNLAKHLGRNIEAEIISSKEVKKPATLTAANIKFPLESGISISQVPVPKPQKIRERPANSLQRKVGLTSVNLPPNLPISLSVTPKSDNRKQKPSNDEVIVIE